MRRVSSVEQAVLRAETKDHRGAREPAQFLSQETHCTSSYNCNCNCKSGESSRVIVALGSFLSSPADASVMLVHAAMCLSHQLPTSIWCTRKVVFCSPATSLDTPSIQPLFSLTPRRGSSSNLDHLLAKHHSPRTGKGQARNTRNRFEL